MNDRTGEGTKKVVALAVQGKDQRNQSDPIDQSGHAILGLLHQAADMARDNCDRAMDMANKLSAQLRAAEDQMRQLEREAGYYRERTARAEKWLAHISNEIESKFFEDRSAAHQGQQKPRA
jgi:hypothetical protein